MDEVARAGIAALLNPTSIAIIGASSDREGLGGRPLEILRQREFRGPIHLVNPRTPEIAGMKTVGSVGEIATPVDLAAILVAPRLVPQVVDECGAAGVKSAYIFTSGFGESTDQQGSDLQAELADACSRWPIRVAGPNGEGMYNALADIAVTFTPVLDHERGAPSFPPPGNVAVLAQSGGIAFGILSQGLMRGIRFSYVISTGNEVDLELLDYLEYLTTDDSTSVIVLFVEGFKIPARVHQIAQLAARQKKYIVVLKIGHTVEGQKAAMSHTGHLSGRSDLYSAVFRHYGMIEVTDMVELLDITSVLATNAVPSGRRAGIFTASGGASAWLTDALFARGLSVPELSHGEQAEIAEVLPYYANPRNPVDYTGGAQDQLGVKRALEILSASASIDVVIVVLSLMNKAAVERRLPMLLDVLKQAGKPMIVYSYTAPTEAAARVLADAGVPWFVSQTGLANAVATVVEQQARAATVIAAAGSSEPGGELFAHGEADFETPEFTLTEYDVKLWLSKAGMPVPRGELVSSEAGAVDAAHALGYPVVLKLQSVAAAHKTEIGAVVLDVGSDDELHDAWAQVTRPVGTVVPPAQVQGVLIEAQAPPGQEMLIGVVSDPGLGSFVVVGSGGTEAELLRDVQIMVAPVSLAEAEAAIRRLTLAPLLTGWRGRPPRDIAALARAVQQVSELATDASMVVRELDLNPVVVYDEGAGIAILDGLAQVGTQPS